MLELCNTRKTLKEKWTIFWMKLFNTFDDAVAKIPTVFADNDAACKQAVKDFEDWIEENKKLEKGGVQSVPEEKAPEDSVSTAMVDTKDATPEVVEQNDGGDKRDVGIPLLHMLTKWCQIGQDFIEKPIALESQQWPSEFSRMVMLKCFQNAMNSALLYAALNNMKGLETIRVRPDKVFEFCAGKEDKDTGVLCTHATADLKIYFLGNVSPVRSAHLDCTLHFSSIF